MDHSNSNRHETGSRNGSMSSAGDDSTGSSTVERIPATSVVNERGTTSNASNAEARVAHATYKAFRVASTRSVGTQPKGLTATRIVHLQESVARNTLRLLLTSIKTEKTNEESQSLIGKQESAMVTKLETLLRATLLANKPTLLQSSSDAIDCFKAPEFLYFRSKILPSTARGLFFAHPIEESGTSTFENGDKAKVALRGYDKFFEVGETNLNEWPALQSVTKGPYVVTEKINGFIMLVSQSPSHPDTLLIASKSVLSGYYSTRSLAYALALVLEQRKVLQHIPTGKDASLYDIKAVLAGLENTEKDFICEEVLSTATHIHSTLARNELLQHLEANNITEKQLAHALENLTAVFEVVNDDLDEHVFLSAPEDQGIYLHGLNRNTITYDTLPIKDVISFGDKFKFRSVDTHIFESIDQVIEFTTKTELEGYGPRHKPIEGFVVRCHRVKESLLRKYQDNMQAKKKSKNVPKSNDQNKDLFSVDDYDMNTPYLFKIKIRNMYSVYRNIRQVTSNVIDACIEFIPKKDTGQKFDEQSSTSLTLINDNTTDGNAIDFSSFNVVTEITEEAMKQMLLDSSSRNKFGHRIMEIFQYHARYFLSSSFVEWCVSDVCIIPWIQQTLRSEKGVNSKVKHKLDAIRSRFLNDIGIGEETGRSPILMKQYILDLTSYEKSNIKNESLPTCPVQPITKLKSLRKDYVLLMPFAPPGMGKSTLAHVLQAASRGVVRSISSDENRRNFLDNFTSLFGPYTNIVFLDSMNHIAKKRSSMIQQFFEMFPNGRLLLLQLGFFSEYSRSKGGPQDTKSTDKGRKKSNVTKAYSLQDEIKMSLLRIEQRGDDHLTLKYEPPSKKEVFERINDKDTRFHDDNTRKILSCIHSQADRNFNENQYTFNLCKKYPVLKQLTNKSWSNIINDKSCSTVKYHALPVADIESTSTKVVDAIYMALNIAKNSHKDENSPSKTSETTATIALPNMFSSITAINNQETYETPIFDQELIKSICKELTEKFKVENQRVDANRIRIIDTFSKQS